MSDESRVESSPYGAGGPGVTGLAPGFRFSYGLAAALFFTCLFVCGLAGFGGFQAGMAAGRIPAQAPRGLFGAVGKDTVALGVEESAKWRELIEGLSEGKQIVIRLEDKK